MSEECGSCEYNRQCFIKKNVGIFECEKEIVNSEEIKFDHFKDINELLEHIDLWYKEDDIEYTRWFGLEDLYNLKIYITYLQQKVEQLEKENDKLQNYVDFYKDLTKQQIKKYNQLENIRKEAIEYIDEHQLVFELSSKKQIQYWFDEFYRDLLSILNKGSEE